MLWSTIKRSRRDSSVGSIFSYTLSSVASISTLHSPFSQLQKSVRLLIPWQNLYTKYGCGSSSLGFTQFGNSLRLSASYHRYWSRYASVIFSSGSISYTGISVENWSRNCSDTSLNTCCVSRYRLICCSVSCGLSKPRSIRPSSSRCSWFIRLLLL